MKKKLGFLSLVCAVMLSGCIPGLERSEEDVIVVEETEEEEEIEYIITPTIESPDHFYRNVLVDGTYQRSESRGSVAHSMNSRIDINQFELGLMEIASGVYDQEEYYFQEGTFLSGGRINSWLRRYDPEEERYMYGLNPPLADEESTEDQMGDNPIVLSHIMEHNYYTGSEEEGVSLGGVVMGISLNDVYYFQTEDEDGGYHFHERDIDGEEALEYGRRAAQTMLERMREMEGLEEVPITFALYQEEGRGSVVPGTFVSLSQAGSGEMELGNWEAINEDYFVFPSNRARDVQPNLSSSFSQFREDIENFFDHQVGVVGKGRYNNENLNELKIELNLQSHGKAEIIALTQFISGRLDSAFSVNVPIYVYIESVNGSEGLVVQYPEQEPYIHVYR
ncbi:CamS family sex pheromone protein [Salipaludibacillus aurantiacus]|uniref:Protein involved in sex pheromone biosynthesis n=1 Tax=Salipaludibacillus aurantiacus TaxID=1601833 RepID=A0A1H9TS97_9BACI|nr:CamS family sex pheromone protein [Salipaludibacillus aurantiacus]SER99949.1 Protein involved in sex pheromone biosynthesis [Salipaludibacillus aurantiacus]